MSAVCVWAMGGVLLAALPPGLMELRWIHSVERIEWRETWAPVPGGLRLVAARIKGTGAGMEPADDAKLIDGWYVWHPDGPLLAHIDLAASSFTGSHALCVDAKCQKLSDLLSDLGGNPPVTLTNCDER